MSRPLSFLLGPTDTHLFYQPQEPLGPLAIGYPQGFGYHLDLFPIHKNPIVIGVIVASEPQRTEPRQFPLAS